MATLYESNIWSELGDVSLHNKALYMILWSRADKAGVSPWNLDEIRAVAGHRFHTTDLQTLGDRVVELDSGDILLTRYLLTHNKRLSRKCPAHNPVFEAIHARWGEQNEDGTEPALAIWRDKGVSKFFPPIIDEYHGEGPMPKWLADHIRHAEAAKKVKLPPKWGEVLKRDVESYIDERVEMALAAKTYKACKETKWNVKLVEFLIRKVNDWLKESTENQVSVCIANAIFGNHLNIYAPKHTTKSSAGAKKQNTEPPVDSGANAGGRQAYSHGGKRDA